MAYAGPGVGPWEIAEMDVHLINEVFRQIEQQINLLRGLGPIVVSSSGTVTSGGIAIGPHNHETSTTGGKLSHDDALVDVSANDHHDEEHSHEAGSDAGDLPVAVDFADGWATSKPADFIIAGTGITITESDESEGLVISGSGASFDLTVKEADGSPSVSSVDTIAFDGATVTDNGSGDVTIAITASGGGGTDVQWSVLASAAELIFDSDGDVIMTELCQPSSCA